MMNYTKKINGELPPKDKDFDHLVPIPNNLKGLFYAYGQGSSEREVKRKFIIPLGHIVELIHYKQKNTTQKREKVTYQEYLELSEEEKNNIIVIKITNFGGRFDSTNLLLNGNDIGITVLYEYTKNIGNEHRATGRDNYIKQIRKDGLIYMHSDR